MPTPPLLLKKQIDITIGEDYDFYLTAFAIISTGHTAHECVFEDLRNGIAGFQTVNGRDWRLVTLLSEISVELANEPFVEVGVVASSSHRMTSSLDSEASLGMTEGSDERGGIVVRGRSRFFGCALRAHLRMTREGGSLARDDI